jgi:hypothetical protein
VGFLVGAVGAEPEPPSGEVRALVGSGLALAGFISVVDTIALVIALMDTWSLGGLVSLLVHIEVIGLADLLEGIVVVGLMAALVGVLGGLGLARTWRDVATLAARRWPREGTPPGPAAAVPPSDTR